MIPRIHIVRTSDGVDFPLPSYTSKHHVGLNLMAGIGGPVKVNPGERLYVPTGFAIALPDGLCGQVVSNTQLALEHGIIVLDAPSVIHPGDRKPLMVLLQNESEKQFILRRGMLIAQLLILPALQVAWNEVAVDLSHSKQTPLDEMFFEEGEPEVKRNTNESTRRQHVSIRERSKNE